MYRHFLNNISFPKSLDELELFANGFNVEEILTVTETEWTAPKWSVEGDIVFFFHAKTSIQWIRKLETKLKSDKPFLPAGKVQMLENALKRARLLYKKYYCDRYRKRVPVLSAGKPVDDHKIVG